jgi:hypothetical protein
VLTAAYSGACAGLGVKSSATETSGGVPVVEEEDEADPPQPATATASTTGRRRIRTRESVTGADVD